MNTLTSKYLPGAILLLLVCLVPNAIVAGSADENRYWTPGAAFGGEGLVDAIVSVGDEIIFGGRFTSVDGLPYANCVRWNGERWKPVGGAIGNATMGLVHSVVVNGDDVFVAGMFDQVSGVWPASNVAHWNGFNWNDMDGGTDRAVRCVARRGNGHIYAGGEFTTAGGVPARGIARWDGQRWHALGEGVNNHVMSIVIRGKDVYVGGRFSMAGGKRIPFLARWDGQEWHPVGTGVNNMVTSLRMNGTQLYVGGLFTSAGGKSARGIARWNGNSWFTLGGGVSGPGLTAVRSILVDGGDVYAGGFFTHAGGENVNYLARWDGKEWQGLGSGVDYTVKNMARHGRYLYVTGEFENAGDKPSRFVARWYKPAVYFEAMDARQSGNKVTLSWGAIENEDFAGFRVYRKTGAADEELLTEATLDKGARTFEDTPLDGIGYDYEVAAVLADGAELRTESVRIFVAAQALTMKNYPNPFTRTQFEYVLPGASQVTLQVYDVKGRLVSTVVNSQRAAGRHFAAWNGTNQNGAPAPSGVYFYRLKTSGDELTRKMMLLR